MKIGPLEPLPLQPLSSDRQTSAAPATAAPVAEPSSTVALSSAATQLASGTSDATFDTAKVDRIAQAVRDGKFKVNPEAIADKLIANASELLGRAAS